MTKLRLEIVTERIDFYYILRLIDVTNNKRFLIAQLFKKETCIYNEITDMFTIKQVKDYQL